MQKIDKDPKEMTNTEWEKYLASLRNQHKQRSAKAAEKRKLTRHLQKTREKKESAHKRRRLGLIESQVYLDLLRELSAREQYLVKQLKSLD